MQQLLLILLVIFTFSHCTVIEKTIRGIDMNSSKSRQLYEFSEVKTAKATVQRFFIFSSRTFSKHNGYIEPFPQAVIPVYQRDTINFISSNINSDYTPPLFVNFTNYGAYREAVYKLITENPEYEVVGLPTFEIKKFFIPIFYRKTTVIIKANLGKRKVQ